MSDEQHSLTGPYVADALGDDERRMFEQHLEVCVACRREVDALQDVAASLGIDDLPMPPPGLRARVLAAIEDVEQEPAPAATGEPGQRTEASLPLAVAPGEAPITDSAIDSTAAPATAPPARRRWRVLPVAAAAALAVVAGVLGVATLRLQERVDVLEAQRDQVNELLAAQRVTPVALTPAGESQARIMWAPDHGAGVLVAEGMPRTAGGHVYQVWFVHDDLRVSAGTLQVGADGGAAEVVTGDLDNAGAVMVTVEPLGGSDQPTSEPLMVTQLGT